MPILIGYANKKLERICLEARVTRKNLPQNVAKLLPQRLVGIAAFASLGAIPAGAPWHFHALSGDWTGCLSVWIDKKYRIIFRPAGAFAMAAEGMPDLATVTQITIESIEDYHD
jgi:toxin HigB-1